MLTDKEARQVLEALEGVIGWVPGRTAWHTEAPMQAVEKAREAATLLRSRLEKPAGEWVTVPREPTQEMLDAGALAMCGQHAIGDDFNRKWGESCARKTFADMLDAAPAAPQPPGFGPATDAFGVGGTSNG